MSARAKIDAELYGTGLLGTDLAPKKSGELSRRFMVPPFTVLSAREGWWQDRKKAWLALGIQSELGRGEDMTWGTGNDLDGYRHDVKMQVNRAAPGGSAMPAMNYKNRERGTGSGQAVGGTAAERPRSDVVAPAPTATGQASQAEPRKRPRLSKELSTPPKKRFAAPTVIISDDEDDDRAPGRRTAGRAQSNPNAVRKPLPELSVLAEARRYGDEAPVFDRDTWDDSQRQALLMDVESFPNFFLVCFESVNTGKRLSFEMSERGNTFDPARIREILAKHCIVTFNGLNYDVPILSVALAGGADTYKLKSITDRIITGSIPHWKFEETFGVRLLQADHIDLSETNPSVRQSLKILAGRLHSPVMMELPYAPDRYLSRAEMNVVTLYCMNDLARLKELLRALEGPLKLRVSLGRQYGLDLRSKSDAQVGEAVVLERVRRLTGRRPFRRRDMEHEPFRYDIPPFISFKTDQMNAVLDMLRRLTFTVGAHGVNAPAELKSTRITIGSMVYQMGIGGLHSTEGERSVVADDEHSLWDADVASHYPAIMLKLGMYPDSIGRVFQQVLKSMVQDRLDAKRRAAADPADKQAKDQADGGKIAVNGVFGKILSVMGVLSCPSFGIAITLTGQLSVLMLIERAELAGIPVMSGNTDGVLFKCPRTKEPELFAMIKEWEAETGFEVETTPYRAIYNRDVNTYLAVKKDGKVKRKGPIANPWTDGDVRGQLSKNPQMEICSDALVAYVLHGTPFEETIRAAKHPKEFVTVTRVNEGAIWRGHKLGKVIRYYWSTDGDPILRASSKGKVGRTAGARPLMEMTELPDDIDYARYVDETYEMAYSLAIIPRPQHQRGMKV